MAVVLSILSGLCYGTGDFLGSVAARKNIIIPVVVVSQLAGLAAVLIAAPLTGAASPTLPDFAWGAFAGIGGSVGLALIYSGIAKYGAGIVSPTGALVGTLIPVVFGIILGERPGVPGMAGMGIALPAVLLLTAELDSHGRVEPEEMKGRRAASRKALAVGTLAGLGFGVFFLAVSRAGAGAGLWPLVGARIASISFMTILGLFTRTEWKLSAERRWAIPLAGILDMAANIFFLLATRSGLLVLVAVITSLYPAPTVILSRIAFRERLTPPRLAGIALAVTGVALMSM